MKDPYETMQLVLRRGAMTMEIGGRTYEAGQPIAADDPNLAELMPHCYEVPVKRAPVATPTPAPKADKTEKPKE